MECEHEWRLVTHQKQEDIRQIDNVSEQGDLVTGFVGDIVNEVILDSLDEFAECSHCYMQRSFMEKSR